MQKKKPLFNTITIVGVGLIGGSLGLAIKKNKLAERVVGIGHRKSSIQKALRKKAIDEGSLNLKSGVKQADLIILATPVSLILKFLKEISAYLKPRCLIIDVGSSKEEIVRTAEKNLTQDNSFIGCHPIAGSEKRGIEIARDNLFKKAVCIITPTQNSNRMALKKIKRLWEKLGSQTEIISPEKHDRLMATVSHLPHLVATGLVLKLQKESQSTSYWSKFIGPGFKDTTRIAASSPSLWQDICFSNRKNIISNLKALGKILEELERCLKNNQKKDFLRYLDRAKKWREEIR